MEFGPNLGKWEPSFCVKLAMMMSFLPPDRSQRFTFDEIKLDEEGVLERWREAEWVSD